MTRDIFFDANKIACEKRAAANDAVIFFDLVENDFAAEKAEPIETKKKHAGFFAAANLKKNLRAASLNNFFGQSTRSFSAPKHDAKRLFRTMLVYLNRNICLDEMAENLEKLNRAAEMRYLEKINRVAYDCAELCADCGMRAAIAPLLELESFENENQWTRVSALVREIRREYERARAIVETNLERVAARQTASGAAFV